MNVFFLSLLLVSPFCYGELNVDKLFATLGGRSASPYRSHVRRVIEQQAAKLNVTSESHLDTCKRSTTLYFVNFTEIDASLQRFNTKNRDGRTFNNSTDMFAALKWDASDAYYDVDASFRLINAHSKNMSKESRKFSRKMYKEFRNAILMIVFEEGSDLSSARVMEIMTPPAIYEYNNLPSETKLELEREFCPVTLLKMRDSEESHKILESFSSPFE